MPMGKKKKDVVAAETPATVVSETSPETEVQAAATAQPPAKPVVLFSSEKGAIACKDHTPIRGSDSWRFDRWRKMKVEEIEAIERELGRKIACETCAAVERKVDASEHVADANQAPVAQAASVDPEPPKSKRIVTLADLAERYVAQMERKGNAAGTISSYGMELKTAIAALGADTPIAMITPSKVTEYFGSDRVTKLRSGKAKSQLSIDKTRRVLRLALVWAVDAKLLKKAPLPEDLATH
jgi:hypothetical protein